MSDTYRIYAQIVASKLQPISGLGEEFKKADVDYNDMGSAKFAKKQLKKLMKKGKLKFPLIIKLKKSISIDPTDILEEEINQNKDILTNFFPKGT